MERFTKSKTKFSRMLRNKMNRSLALINSNRNCSDKTCNVDIINNCLENTENYYGNENITNLNESQIKSLFCINYNDVDASISDNNVHDNANNLVNDIRYEDSNAKTDIPLVSKLAKWAIEENITLSALKNLLSIIQEVPGCDNIPKDPRTVLNTPNDIKVTPLGCGTYYYFGIEKTLNSFCTNRQINIEEHEDFLLAINIDGLPLSKSTNSSFWPILCSIKSIEVIMNEVFVVALYHGSEKPKPIDNFLRDFVNECVHLSNNGIFINSLRHSFRILMLVCDTPAKSFILSIKSHAGHFSCTKCDQEGDLFNNVLCFIETERFCKRTDISFRTIVQPEHHTGKSLLLDIPNFNIIDSVPIDYMHSLLLGGMKKLLCHKRYGWIFGKPPYKLRARDVTQISENLLKIKRYMPREFSRKTRSIVECKRFKATEFRFLLLYAGLIVFKDVLSPKVYNNFITLSLASSIMISKYYSRFENYISYANDLMKHFICQTIKIYGPDFISHNIHNFLHLSDCVKLYGSLDNFSAFPFENYMQQLKKKVRKSAQPLQQVVHRIIEESNNSHFSNNANKDSSIKFLMEHFDGPLVSNCMSPQYRKVQTNDYYLNTSNIADRFVELKNNTIIEIKNFAHCGDSVCLIGYKCSKQDSFYYKPCTSSLFDIQYIKIENKCYEVWNINCIRRKLVVLPYKKSLISFPLLHM